MSKKQDFESKTDLENVEKKFIKNNVLTFKRSKNFLNTIENIHVPRWKELPDIDLYLDQLVTLLDKYLSPYVGDNENPIITKTMINNYVKQGTIAPPEKKKYNREHIASIFVICILKSVYSISNVSALLKLATTDFRIDISYNKFCELFERSMKSIFLHEKIEFSQKATDSEILLQNVIQSVVYKIYVEKSFLEDENENNESV